MILPSLLFLYRGYILPVYRGYILFALFSGRCGPTSVPGYTKYRALGGVQKPCKSDAIVRFAGTQVSFSKAQELSNCFKTNITLTDNTYRRSLSKVTEISSPRDCAILSLKGFSERASAMCPAAKLQLLDESPHRAARFLAAAAPHAYDGRYES